MLACLAAVSVPAAWGDDWPQFRKDHLRSAVSSDPVAVPLTEIWPAGTNLVPAASPLFEASVWHGRVYYISRGVGRSLICADAQSGVVLWRRPLSKKVLECALSDRVAPA